MNEPDESMYCSWGDHWTDKYINYFSNGSGGICEDCAEREAEEQEELRKQQEEKDELNREEARE